MLTRHKGTPIFLLSYNLIVQLVNREYVNLKRIIKDEMFCLCEEKFQLKKFQIYIFIARCFRQKFLLHKLFFTFYFTNFITSIILLYLH